LLQPRRRGRICNVITLSVNAAEAASTGQDPISTHIEMNAAATPDAIAYVTGGVAVGEVMTAGTVFGFDGNGNPVNTISSHNTQAGWTVGGGIEGCLAGNWTAKIEYLYLDLGTVTTIPAPAPGATTAVAFNSRVTGNRATSAHGACISTRA